MSKVQDWSLRRSRVLYDYPARSRVLLARSIIDDIANVDLRRRLCCVQQP